MTRGPLHLAWPASEKDGEDAAAPPPETAPEAAKKPRTRKRVAAVSMAHVMRALRRMRRGAEPPEPAPRRLLRALPPEFAHLKRRLKRTARRNRRN